MRDDYTELTRAEIASTALGTSPRGIAAIESLQAAAYVDNPADTAAAQQAADTAQTSANTAQASADTAQSSADTAQASANDAQSAADTAQGSADAANANAETRVKKDDTPVWSAAPAGSVLRMFDLYEAPQPISPSYNVIQMQALVDQMEDVTRVLMALVTDLRANGALKD